MAEIEILCPFMMCLNSRCSKKIASSTLFFVLTASWWEAFVLECITSMCHLQPLGDAYGLLMHRNGQWEWTLAPGISPSPRYQHAAVSEEAEVLYY